MLFLSFSVVSNFFRLLFSCCCVEWKEEILPLSLSNSPRFSHRERGQKKEKKKKNASSFSLSLSLSKRTSFFLRARVFSLINEWDFCPSFSFFFFFFCEKSKKKKKLLLLLLYVCGEITAHRTRIACMFAAAVTFFLSAAAAAAAVLCFSFESQSLYISLFWDVNVCL